MPKDYDVMVIGAGAAGCMAASTAASLGRSVALVGRFNGATAQSSGAIDAPFDHEKGPAALSAFVALAADVGLSGRSDGQVVLAATEAGTLKRCVLTQKTQFFDIAEFRGEKIVVVGFGGLPSFDAHAVARMLGWSANRHLGRNVRVEAKVCDVKGPMLWRSCLEMSKYVDEHPAMLQQALQTLSRQEGESTTFLIPAVLGRKSYREHAFANVFELLAMPHSVPGLRLTDALRGNLARLKVDVIQSEATRAHKEGDVVTRIELEGGSGAQALTARAIILATGRYFSGGFVREGVRTERLFGLPLWYDNKMIADLPSRQLTRDAILDQHPLLSAHLRADPWQRPYDRVMQLFARNLYVAGSALHPELSLGSAALSGYLSAFHTQEA